MKRSELSTLVRAVVAVGLIILVGLMFLLLPHQPVLIPAVVMMLLGLLATMVGYYFPKRG
jgi:hypothetical protein